MARLGSFGDAAQPRPAEPDTFLYFGAELRISPEFTDAELFDFIEVSGELKEEDPAAALAVKGLMRNAFGDDFDTFWALARKHGQTLEQRMKVVFDIVEALAGRPTERSSVSSGGPRTTGVISMADYALAAQRRLEGQGRPDLAVAALRFRQAQERAATG